MTLRLRPWHALLVLIPLGTPAFAYWGETHGRMNAIVAVRGQPFNFTRGGQNVQKLDDYLKTVLLVNKGADKSLQGVEFAASGIFGWGSDTPVDDPSGQEKSLLTWLVKGAYYEDGFSEGWTAKAFGGLRAVNHFHDPLHPPAWGTDGGYTGLAVQGTLAKILQSLANSHPSTPVINLLRSGISASNWSSGATSGTQSNEWSLKGLGVTMNRFLNPSDKNGKALQGDDARKESGTGLAASFRAMGQFQHLVEDNTVPDHARDLPHPGDGFEEFVKSDPAAFSSFTYNKWQNYVLPLDRVDKNGVTAFWYQNLYSGDPSKVQASVHPGIDEYTAANFFAFNRWNTPKPVQILAGFSPVVEFSTLPTAPDAPGSSCSSPNGCRSFPAPVFTGSNPPGYFGRWASGANSQPLACAAWGPIATSGQRPRWIVNDICWKEYEQYLLPVAAGYAQAALALTLPSIDAEFLPDPANPLSNAVVRIRNLAAASDPQAITWNIQSVSIHPVLSAKPAPNPLLPDFGKNLTIPVGGSATVAPGSHWDSAPVPLSNDIRYTLLQSQHTQVMVVATMGSGSTAPKLTFGVTVPAALGLIEQTSTTETSQTGSVNVSNCCSPPNCAVCGENAELHSAVSQQVKGDIRLFASHVDLFGDDADSDVKSIEDSIVHVTGVAIISMANGFNPPTVLQKTQLTVTDAAGGTGNGGLQPVPGTPSVWVRDPTYTGPESNNLSFTASIDLTELITNPTDSAMALRASDSMFIVAWTAGGQIWAERLVLWALQSGQTAQAIAGANPCQYPGDGTTTAEFMGSCFGNDSIDSNGSCVGSYEQHQDGLMYTTLGFSVPTPDAVTEVIFQMMMGRTKPEEIGGMGVNTGIGILPTNVCSTLSGSGTCFDSTIGLVGYNVTDQGGNGTCSSIPGMTVISPKTAKYQRVYNLEDITLQILHNSTALPQPPAELNMTLQ